MVVQRSSEPVESPGGVALGVSAAWSQSGQRSGATATSLSPGTIIAGKYELLRELGVGGSGTVFQARHLGLESDVAVKIIHPSLIGDELSLRRFRREARAAFYLRHPNIVRVLDFGEEPLPHIVMEYVQGTSLGEFLSDLALPPPLTLVAGVSRQILSALEAAHTKNIVHRDLKPDNVLLLAGADGKLSEAKVVDFGLAHFEDERDAGPTLTHDGVIAGTPAYMSPEQCRSLVVGPASDLYAFGCLLTELLQLSTPFGDAPSALLLSQQMFMPPPKLRRPEGSEPVSEALEELRLALLAKHAHQRPQSAAHVRELLDAALEDVSSGRKARTDRGSLGPLATSELALDEQRRTLLSVISDNESSLNSVTETGLCMQGIDLVPDDRSQVRLLIDARPLPEVREQLLRLKRDDPRPILVVTSQGGARDVLQLVEAGAADILKPPLSPDTLAVSVLRVARRSEAARTPAG